MSNKITSKLVVPLLNKKITLFNVPNLYLEDDIFITNIKGDEYIKFESGLQEEYNIGITSKTKCLVILNPNEKDIQENTNMIATKVKFLFNNFKDNYPLMMSFAGLLNINKLGNHRLKEHFEVRSAPDFHKFKNCEYKLRKGTTKKDIIAYYSLISKAVGNHKNILIALERYNMCLTRTFIFDRIIDATICLEALVSSTTELSFRLSLFNSFISEKDPTKRQRVFELLKKLYDSRSKIVHGSLSAREQKNIDYLMRNWGEVFKVISASLNYYLIYIANNNITNWDNHLINLVFGTENLITS